MMIGIISTVRPLIDRRKTVLGNPKRVEPKDAAATHQSGSLILWLSFGAHARL